MNLPAISLIFTHPAAHEHRNVRYPIEYLQQLVVEGSIRLRQIQPLVSLRFLILFLLLTRTVVLTTLLLVVNPLDIDVLLPGFQYGHELLQPVEIAGANLLLIESEQLTEHHLDILDFGAQGFVDLCLHLQ